MNDPREKDEALFETLKKNKKRRRRRLVLTIVAVVLIAAIVLAVAVASLRRQVLDRFAAAQTQVLSYQASRGTVSATISGTGVLAEVGLEQLSVPAGVEIVDVLAEQNDQVAQGDVLATVDMSSVMQAMSQAQAALDELDGQLQDAKDEEVDEYILAGVAGRVKRIYAQEGMDVTACMYEHGALAVLSIGGRMAVDIPAGALSGGDSVTVTLADGTAVAGTVEKAAQGVATVLVTDDGPADGETVTVTGADGASLGSGSLYIRDPLRVTGFAGTVSQVRTWENEEVAADDRLFTLENTGYSAGYEKLLRQRQEQEDTLMTLLALYRDGAVLAPFGGVVSSVEYGQESNETVSGLPAGFPTAGTAASGQEDTAILTLYPNAQMEVTIGIGETDILSLEVGQEAEVVVSSVSDQRIPGTVTKIDRTADALSGVTQYSAVVTVSKTAGMLTGMTADVDVKIQGVENAVLIPVDALHHTSTISYVFTSYDEEADQYGGMVEVVPGLEGSSYVEIISGLNEGDTVYYTEVQDFFFNFGGMGGMGGWNGSRSASGPESGAWGR